MEKKKYTFGQAVQDVLGLAVFGGFVFAFCVMLYQGFGQGL